MTKPSEVTAIAVFGERLAGIQKTVEATAKSVEEIKTARYVTQNEMQLAISSAVQGISEQLADIKKTSNLWRWLSPTLSSMLTAAVTFLLISYLQHFK